METIDRIPAELDTELGIYSAREKEKISAYIQRILKGELPVLISEKSFPEGVLQKSKESFLSTFDKMIKSALEVSKAADDLTEAASRKAGTFSFKISESEKPFILAAASNTIQRIYALRELILSDLTLLYAQAERLLQLQGSLFIYTSELEIIKSAAELSDKLYGTKHSESTLFDPLSSAYSEIRSASELEKRVFSLASMYEDTFERKIYRMLDGIAEAADLSGDGERLSPSKVTDEAINIKNSVNKNVVSSTIEQ